jgi:hypothetical protein
METHMHPDIHYEIAKAQVATLHAQGRRDALARTACRARRAQRQKPEHPALALAAVRRWVLTVLGAHLSWSSYHRPNLGVNAQAELLTSRPEEFRQ